MSQYFIRRMLLMIPTFIGVTLVGFTITRLVPGGPLERALMKIRFAQATEGGAVGGPAGALGQIPEASIHEMKKAFDLDRPAPVAYVLWLGKLFSFDLGKSYKYRKPVTHMIRQRLHVSLVFGLSGFVLSYLISVPLGIAKGIYHRSVFDFVSSAAVFVGYSIPGWALGALLLAFLASGRFLAIFPLGGVTTSNYEDLPRLVKAIDAEEDVCDEFGVFEWERLSWASRLLDRVHHMILPVLCYTMVSFTTLTILTKNSLMDNLSADYVRTALAKGVSPFRSVVVHALRNSLIPLATGLGSALSLLMAGAYLIELVFNIDGIGYLGFTAIVDRDYTVVMGILAINTALVLLGNILSDFLYAMIDPRIRFS